MTDPRDISINDFNYELQDERIAKYPPANRDASRLLVWKQGRIQDAAFTDLGAHLPAGSVLVSYVKARAEGLGYQAKVGLLTRVERYLVLAPSLVFNQLYLGLGIIAIFANITALQRIWHVRSQAHLKLRD